LFGVLIVTQHPKLLLPLLLPPKEVMAGVFVVVYTTGWWLWAGWQCWGHGNLHVQWWCALCCSANIAALPAVSCEYPQHHDPCSGCEVEKAALNVIQECEM
jgi:hypothetical protein